MRKIFVALLCAAAVSGCAIHRAQEAHDAREQMVGLTKEQVLGCMGPPIGKAAEGQTEVWTYNSGNNMTTVSTFGTANTNVGAYGNRNYATAQATTTSTGFGVARSRYCVINVTMLDGRVSRINYVGPTGGLLTQGEQCSFAVQNCIH